VQDDKESNRYAFYQINQIKIEPPEYCVIQVQRISVSANRL